MLKKQAFGWGPYDILVHIDSHMHDYCENGLFTKNASGPKLRISHSGMKLLNVKYGNDENKSRNVVHPESNTN